jgi:hypothetical protein
MGSKITSTITGSTIGAVGIGNQAHTTGTVTIGSPGLMSQDQHRTAIKEAQAALVHDQDALDQLDGRLYEALGQFLRLAREIQVEQKSVVDVQLKMKDVLDEVWAQQEVKGFRPQVLPKTLEVAEALVKNPAMAAVVKKLLGA